MSFPTQQTPVFLENESTKPFAPSAFIWMRLNSSPLLRSIKPRHARAFIATLAGLQYTPKSLVDLTGEQLATVRAFLISTSNPSLERAFLEFLTWPLPPIQKKKGVTHEK